ncbi:geranylgeranyl diphosphate synthase IdsB [Nocardia sp. NPDC051463]|uniref:geranylgeranyl diphosphate synthase IdsB n=1 Tax=Nocardia sp. NPDC051463 TaxID=3154845 RepID=UPI00344B07DC
MSTTSTPNATGIAVGNRSAEDLLAQARMLCDPPLRASIESLPNPLRHMAGYHFGWWDAAGNQTRADSGKAVRPALTMCAATACGGNWADAMWAAVAVELVHNFTLIHDDIMDADATRRGRPAVWKVWGVADAVLLGDALHALAIRVLASEALPEGLAAAAIYRLETAVVEMCRGQSEDCSFETRYDVDTAEYIEMVMGKTGALMGCACALGALSAGADSKAVSAMDSFGRELGLAFQFADDVIGIWGDPRVTGKPAGNDLARRKRSLPVIAALESNTSAATELAALYRSDAPMTAQDILHATALIEAAAGRHGALSLADHSARKAVGMLREWHTAGDLMTLTGVIAHRDR